MFSKGKAAGGPGRSGGAFSYLGSEVTVTGDIATESELHLDGKVLGDVRCGALTQGESGEVRGNIRAGRGAAGGAGRRRGRGRHPRPSRRAPG